MAEPGNENRNNKKTIYLLVALLFISIGFNIYLLNRTSRVSDELVTEKENVENLTAFKENLENQFQAMTFELDQFKGKNIELDSLLQTANADLLKQKNKIERLIRENKDIPLLQRQLEEMKAIRDQYRIQIEQLIKENKELKFANVNLTQEVDQLSRTTKELSEKVDLASVLKAENIAVQTFREKGKGKLEETDRAKRVSRISTTVAIAENRVAKAGARDLVLRIIKPDGYVLTDPNSGSGSFTNAEGRTSDYTLRRTLEYNNDRKEVIFDWDQIDELKSGLYITEVYLDGRLIGNYKFNLK